ESIYPYSFSKHKGYLTKLHKEEIREYGLSPIHRKSFKIKT
ncbi:MAG: ribonuclease HII, partial [Persephonella sp.]